MISSTRTQFICVVFDAAGVRQRVGSFMHQSPLDGNVTRRVKMAANVIDRFGLCIHSLVFSARNAFHLSVDLCRTYVQDGPKNWTVFVS